MSNVVAVWRARRSSKARRGRRGTRFASGSQVAHFGDETACIRPAPSAGQIAHPVWPRHPSSTSSSLDAVGGRVYGRRERWSEHRQRPEAQEPARVYRSSRLLPYDRTLTSKTPAATSGAHPSPVGEHGHGHWHSWPKSKSPPLGLAGTLRSLHSGMDRHCGRSDGAQPDAGQQPRTGPASPGTMQVMATSSHSQLVSASPMPTLQIHQDGSTAKAVVRSHDPDPSSGLDQPFGVGICFCVRERQCGWMYPWSGVLLRPVHGQTVAFTRWAFRAAREHAPLVQPTNRTLSGRSGSRPCRSPPEREHLVPGSPGRQPQPCFSSSCQGDPLALSRVKNCRTRELARGGRPRSRCVERTEQNLGSHPKLPPPSTFARVLRPPGWKILRHPKTTPGPVDPSRKRI